MSVRFTADHVTTETGLTVTIEILDADFVGTATKGKGVGGSFASFSHQQLDPRDPHSSPIQSGELSASVYIRNATEQTLLDDILNANESRFRMRYYIGATLQWEGFILPDLSSYDEDRTPYIATFVAKDFTSLKGVDYPLTTGRATLISVLSDILNVVDLGVNIVAETSFSNSGIVAANDYLRQIYIDRTSLRTFARTGDEPDEAISYYDALSKILSNNRLVLKQANGVFNIAQFTAYADPTAVTRTVYTSAGALVTELVVNTTQTGQRVTLQSVNNGNPGIKRADVRYDHRTTVSGIQFPTTFRLTDDPLSRVFSQFFVTDGTQALQLTGLVRAQFPDSVTDAKVLIQIRALSRYWNTSTNAWQVGVIANPLDMTDTELSGDKLFYERPISILTSNTPETAGNDIEITVFVARQDAPAIIADFTDFSNFRLEIVNPSVAEGNSTAIDYELLQTGDFSINNSAQSAWFGDGPTSYALSAYSYDSAGVNLTASNWRRRGEALSLAFFELHLREAIDLQRSWTRRISAEVKSNFNPSLVLSYDGIYFVYLGGSFDLYRGVWNIELLRVNIQTSVTDTFSIIYRTTSDASTGSAPASGGGGTSGGITQSFADSRYNQRALNLSDVASAETARTNLGLGSLAVLNELPALTSAGEISFVGGSSEIFDVSTQVFDTSIQVFGSDATDYDGTEPISLRVNVDQVTISYADDGLLFVKDNAISSAKIQTDAVTSDKITSDAVSTIKILDANVTNAKLATDSVSTIKILDANVTNAKLQNSTISGKALGANLDSLSAGNGLTGADYNGSAARSFALGAPGTTAVAGTNAVTAESHTHALDLSGRTLTLTGGDGITIPSASQTLGADRTWTIAADTAAPIAIVGSKIALNIVEPLYLNGANLDIVDATIDVRGVVTTGAQSFAGTKTFEGIVEFDNDFVSDGFTDVADLIKGIRYDSISVTYPNGLLRIGSMRANELRVKSFIAEISAALYGEDILSKSRGVISRDFTVPALLGFATLYVEDLEGFPATPVFEANDYVRIRVVNRAGGGLTVLDTWGQVTSYVDEGDGEQSWTFEKFFGGAAGNIAYAGSIALDYGVSGDGFIRRTVLETQSPRSEMFTWVDVPWDPLNYTRLTTTGKLDTLPGVTGTDIYGFWAKDNFYASFGDGAMVFGNNVDGAGQVGLHINDANYWYGSNRFALGGSGGIQYVGSPAFDESTDVFDTSTLLFNGGTVSIGSDTTIFGTLSLTDSGLPMRIGPNANGLGNAGLFIDSDNYWFPSLGFKVGDATNYIDFDIATSELDIKTTIFKLTTAGLRIDSSLDKKFIVNNGTYDTITIGDFDFAARVNNELTAATTTGDTTSIFTSGTIGYPAGEITSTIGVIETSDRATDQNIISGFRQIDAIKGKWARIRFDWIANGYDDSLTAYAVGYEISYFGGAAIQNVGRDPLDIVRSGSVDTGFVFVPDDAIPRITMNMIAPNGGLIIGNVHERVRITNIVIDYKDDTTYVDIGNPGMRIYKSGGLEGVFFDGVNSEITLKKLGIGEWSFRILNNSNLGLFYKETLRQTFTTS